MYLYQARKVGFHVFVCKGYQICFSYEILLLDFGTIPTQHLLFCFSLYFNAHYFTWNNQTMVMEFLIQKCKSRWS
jgi:hypothetical protein